jgi:hypothetical protein
VTERQRAIVENVVAGQLPIVEVQTHRRRAVDQQIAALSFPQ